LTDRIVAPYFNALSSYRRSRWPLFLLWFGIGISSKVAFECFAGIFFDALQHVLGVKNMDERMLRTWKIMGGSRWQVFRYAILPSALPWVISGIRVSFPYAFIGAITGEFIASIAAWVT